MTAVPDGPVLVRTGSDGVDRPIAPASDRRFVAVAVTAMELLRPGSDLARLLDGAGYADLLLVADDEPVADPAPLGVLDGYADALATDEGCDDAPDDGVPDLRDELVRIGLPELHLHRLGLRRPVDAAGEADVVAALSELVGFDPEPGVYCLAPAQAPTDPTSAVVDRAVQRIARVYGLPLLRYRCHELSVVAPHRG